MRRIIRVLAACSLIVATAWTVAVPGAASAQDEMSMADHPLVGTWTLQETTDGATPFFAIFSPDGAYQQVEDGHAAFGVWEPTGPSTANLSFVAWEPGEDEEPGGAATIRVAIEVAADGMSLTAAFTVQFVSGDFDSGELGPGSVTGTRMMVEPMGTPVGPLTFDEEGTPGATPEM